MSKNNPLDQFFTPDEVADYCVQFFKEATGETSIKILEPCAGGKAFIRAFENNSYSDFEMLDLDPKSSDIRKQDFLEYEESLEGVAVITNPPFGVQNNLSIKFFNQASRLCAEYIATLTLAGFASDQTVNRLNRNYELLDETFIISDFITPEGQSAKMRGTRLVFQVWKRSDIERSKIIRKEYIQWPDNFDDADFWMKCASAPNPIFLKLEDFIYDEKNYTNYRAPSQRVSKREKVINGEIRYMSQNLLGYNKLPEVKIEHIIEACKSIYWKTWCGHYVSRGQLNQFLDEYYSGKTFKTKQF